MKTPQNKGCILVVDDSKDALEVIRRNLEASGFQVYTATESGEALAILDGTAIDLVITDLKMPGGSGLELVRHVRENHGVMVLDCSGETVSIEVDQFNWNRVWGWWSCGVAVLLVSTTSSRAWSFRMAWP